MNDNEKRFYVFNGAEGGPLYRRPLPRLEALGLARFFRQFLEHEGVYVSDRGERLRPEEVVVTLIDADSDEGRRLAELAVRRR